MKNLVIVESPSKSKTIEKYLGSDYKVMASVGHIRDLATSGKFGFGVDIDDHFKPTYKIISGKKKDINNLKKNADNAEKVFLATDPDREGEAISWHLLDTLELDPKKYERVVFNEITKDAILKSFKAPRKIDDDLVKSQETRRILDRIIGFRLSKLMQSKTGGKSAGRVQSVALKLIVDKEREIEAFVSEEYYTIEAYFNDFSASLTKYHGKKIELKSEVEAKEVLNNLSNAFKIENIETKEVLKSSVLPFYTSTLTQAASNKLNFPASKTMRIAQKLYEGIDLGDGPVGLISYMRTDSTRLSEEFVDKAYSYIGGKFGKEYIGSVNNKKKDNNTQDAHEAIRPTDLNNEPDNIKKYLTPDEYKLYKFIYIRTLASLMAKAKTLVTTITLENNGYEFKASGTVYTFLGYLEIYKDYQDMTENILPNFKDYKSDVLVSKSQEYTKHNTEPPARYTEARLIKELETLGIGRPSTYVTIIDILKKRGYISVKEKKFFPTEIGITTTDKLQEFFSEIINVKYTADMETDLDKIADGDKVWYELLESFYKDFAPLVEKAFDNMEKESPKETGEFCPECNKPLIIRRGKYGEFIGCSGYPECKYIKKEEQTIVEVADCILCGGKIVERKTRKGKVFYGCNNYPKCKNAFWDKPLNELCPKCKRNLIETKNGIKCSSCDYTK